MTSPKGSPIALSERAIALDALRGVALFGVLLVNLLTIFRVSLFAQFLPNAGPPESRADHVVSRFLTIGLEFKAFTLFSLLFGVGLGAQHERTRGRGVAFGSYAARRLGFLLVLGLAHLFLVWNGDVLTLYAVLGILAAPLLGLSTRVLLVLAIALFGAHLVPLPFPPPFASFSALRHHVLEANRVYATGTLRRGARVSHPRGAAGRGALAVDHASRARPLPPRRVRMAERRLPRRAEDAGAGRRRDRPRPRAER